MNILEFAKQMELDGKAHYEKLERETPVVGLKKIFSILAADEMKHYAVVDAMASGVMMEMTDSTALENAKNIFQTMQIDEGLLAEMKTKLDGYRHAMKIEADSVRLYEDIVRKESQYGSPALVSLLERIIEEEKKHYNIVENIHYLIARYENFVSWHEFDRIRES
ncbi:MAG: ferritin family protein [Geobacteraceae bacterium]|nr:ferritin family protein [Geobacteraceae bacterium]